jgi:predicted ATPase
MINRVTLRRFKRFDEVTFEIPGHVVIAGPNNTGKTTLLQALAAWSFALHQWRGLNDPHKHGGAYTKCPVTRQIFAAVPLRRFELLWRDRGYLKQHPIEIEVRHSAGWTLCIEIIPDSTEQVYVRPRKDTSDEALSACDLRTVHVPPMTGLGTDEPAYQAQKIEQLLGLGKPGDVLRNLLVLANQDQAAWEALLATIHDLFGYALLPPDASGADIVAEYRERDGGTAFDLASAGSGFQQVLMLLTFLYTRDGTVLLLDEPDAHLHVILQDAIYSTLRRVASERGSQLIIATHSERIIDSVEPRELCVLMHEPRMLSTSAERTNLIRSLSVLSNTDIMLAQAAPGVLYTEGHTDLALLQAWARVLHHPAQKLLGPGLFWRATVWENRHGAKGIRAEVHFDALSLVRDDLPALMLLDGDDSPNIPETELTGHGLQRVRWRRYEIESYLFHPAALRRFVARTVGEAEAAPAIQDMDAYLTANLPPAMLDEPLGNHLLLNRTKARTELLPPILDAAGLPGFPYTRYAEIAAQMRPDEIHPEIGEKLDAICLAFGREPAAGSDQATEQVE